MASLSPDSPLQGLRGKLGGELVFKRYGQKTVVSKYPDMSRVRPSAAQRLQRQRMREAVLFAQLIRRHPELSRLYRADLPAGESVFHAAKKAWLSRCTEQ